MHSFLERNYRPCQSFDVPDLTPPPRIRSARAGIVAKWFGIDEAIEPREPGPPSDPRRERGLFHFLLPKPGQITFVTGPSGAGKSTLLRALHQPGSSARFIDLATIDPPDVPLVDCFDGCDLDQTLALLAQAGLAEAWAYLQTPSELSEGQRWRLKLAIALRRSLETQRFEEPLDPRNRGDASSSSRLSPTIFLIDEFAAVLDRITAMVVARCFRRAIIATGNVGAIVATSHDDLAPALAPDTIVNCDFRLVEVWRARRAIPEGDLHIPHGISRTKSRRPRRAAKPQAGKNRRAPSSSRGLTCRSAPARSIRLLHPSRASVPRDDVATR